MILKVTEPIGSICPTFSSLESLQLQRGVGTSTNGGVLCKPNMLTDSYSKESNGEILLGVLIPENIPLSLVRV
jgi:hypothetical protein